MQRAMYLSIAKSNIYKNLKFFIPYILTSIGLIAMLYIMASLCFSDSLYYYTGASGRALLVMGLVFIVIFSVIFLLYTSSFITNRRIQEYSIFNVLGMEKRHIARTIVYENIMIYLFCIISGLFLGIVLAKLIVLIIAKLTAAKIIWGISISFASIDLVIKVYVVIFLITTIKNIWRIYRLDSLKIIQGNKKDLVIPASQYLYTIIGCLSLGGGYYLASIVQTPFEALALFFIAVILVIIGTYLLFMSIMIFILKFLKKRKKIYYRPENFTTISGMIFRMKKNAIGLANICILSTCVLVIVSFTFTLYLSRNKIINDAIPQDLVLKCYSDTENYEQDTNTIVSFWQDAAIKQSSIKTYMYKSLYNYGIVNQELIEYATNEFDTFTPIFVVNVDFINQYFKTDYTLQDHEIMISKQYTNVPDDYLIIDQQKMTVVKELASINVDINYGFSNQTVIVVNDITQVLKEHDGIIINTLADLQDPSMANEVKDELQTAIRANDNIVANISSKADLTGELVEVFGVILVLGIFLSVIFLMETSVIIYYKQVIEGYEDRKTYQTLKKVGMSNQEIKRTINRQIIVVFFLPLLVAFLHISFAYRMIYLLLEIISQNQSVFYFRITLGCLLIFALIYLIVYYLTSKIYYKIVLYED